jgi:DNA polymerase III subunit delta'
MPFSEIIAQDRALTPLRSALRRGALHHAYLFGGPQGVGKARAAILLSQAANCEAGAERAGALRDDPCGACGPCRKIEKGIHPDVLVLREERAMAKAGAWEPKGGRSPSKDIVVDQVRDLVDRRLALRRHEGRRRFVLIDPAEAMNPQAQNALLKTLEEPPDETTLVLVAARPDALLPTIRSRCLRVGFGPLPPELVAGRLRERIPAEVARRLKQEPERGDEVRNRLEVDIAGEVPLAVALAGGSMGRALELFGRSLRARRDAVLSAADLPPGDAGAWLSFAREHGKDRDSAQELCEVLLVWLRDVVALQAGAAGAGSAVTLALPGVGEATDRVARTVSAPQALRRRREVRRTLAALRQNASPVLALERMLIGWFHGRG